MTNQVPVISPWLVTPSHPPSSLASLDYTRCAVLHNYIIQEGWVGSGRPLDELPRESWFEKHGDDAEQIRNRLDPSLASFLEKAYVIDSTQVSFFYWVSKLSNPDELWRNNGPDFNEPGEDWRFLTLYPTNIGLASDSDGLK